MRQVLLSDVAQSAGATHVVRLGLGSGTPAGNPTDPQAMAILTRHDQRGTKKHKAMQYELALLICLNHPQVVPKAP